MSSSLLYVSIVKIICQWVSVEFFCIPLFEINQCFLPAFVTVQLNKWQYEYVFSDDRTLLLVTFPKSSTASQLCLNLLLICWLQFPLGWMTEPRKIKSLTLSMSSQIPWAAKKMDTWSKHKLNLKHCCRQKRQNRP